MCEIKQNSGLRVSSKPQNDLDLLFVTVISATPFLHFVISGAFLVVIWVSLLVFKQPRKALFEQKQMCVLALVISGYSMIISLISKNVIGVLISFGVLVLLTLGAYLMSVMSAQFFKRVEVVVAIGSISSFVVALLQRLLGQKRPVSGAFNANYLGAVAVLSAIISAIKVFEIFERKTPISKYMLLFTASILANVGTVLLTESRSAQLAFLACAVLIVFLRRHFFLGGIMTLVAIAVVVILLKYGQGIYWNSIFDSFYQRAGIWKDAFGSFSQNAYTVLIGRGPMTYYHVRQVEGLSMHDHAHNLVIDTLLNVGVIGTVLYTLLVIYLLRRMLLLFKQGDRNAFIIAFLAIAEVIVQGIPDVTIMWHQSAILLLLACSSRFKTE